jgi:hypothetical protein
MIQWRSLTEIVVNVISWFILSGLEGVLNTAGVTKWGLIEKKTRSPARDGVAHALGKCLGNGGKIGSVELRVPLPIP